MTGVLVDTNILVYAYRMDPSDPRHGKAKEALAELMLAGGGYVGVQGLAELSSVFLTKLKPPLSPSEIHGIVTDVEAALSVLRPGAETVKGALKAVEAHQLSFWDAMVWSVARENAVGEILTGDFQDGRVVEGVRFRNPLK